MPGDNEFQIASYNTAQQFDHFIKKAIAAPLARRGHRDDYELLFSRDENGGPGGSLEFAKKASSWRERRQTRKQTREELANLINESFGKNFASVRRWGFFEESIGHRLIRDCAPQGPFSVAKVDELALKEIAQRVHALRLTIAEDEQAAMPEARSLRVRTYKDKLKTYILSPKNLKMLYERARSLARKNDSALLSGESDEDYSFIDVDAVQDPAATRPPQPLPSSNRVKDTGPPLIGPYPRHEDLPVIEESIDLVAALVTKTKHDDTARQGTAATVNRPQGTIEGGLYENQRADEFTLSEAHPKDPNQAQTKLSDDSTKRDEAEILPVESSNKLDQENQSIEEVSRAQDTVPDIDTKVVSRIELVFERAVSYHHGTDKIKPQLDKAMKLYREAALGGHQGAIMILAAMEGDVDDRIIQLYNDGLAFLSKAQTDPRDTASGKKAKKCFERAAKLGDAVCQYNLGSMYFFGNGITQNVKLAAKWFVLAGQNQNEYIQMLLEVNKQNATSELQFEIAEALRKGKGEIKPQPSVAREWYELARDNGHPRAQARLNALDKPSIVSKIRKIR